MKIKLIDILDLMIWMLLAVGILVENSWISLSCSTLALILLVISKENKGDEEDDNI